MPKRDESLIINLEDYVDGNGTHWVAVFNSPHNYDIQYFDSFGLFPPDIVISSYLNRANKGIVYNSSMIQGINSIMCGYYCLYFIMHRYKGRPMNEILLDFTQHPSVFNEWLISHFGKIM